MRRGLMLMCATAVCGAWGPVATAQDDDGMFSRRKTRPANAPAAPAPAPSSGEAKPIERKAGAWSVVLAAFRGERQAEAAREMLAKVSNYQGLGGVFIDSRGEGKATVVAVGRFTDPGAPDAVAFLERVRGLEVEGKRPFAGAFLAPPGELIDLGTRPEFNLVRAKDLYGTKAQYTLQVAAYGRKDVLDAGRLPTEDELKESRRAAEDAAATLRREGELAFFFHGPKFSSVCIGVWSDDDFAKRANPNSGEPGRGENPELTALRERFPHNLYNGAGIKVKTRDGSSSMQTSSIVRIPER